MRRTPRFTLVAIALALGISACGGSSGSSSSSSSSAAATPPAASSSATSSTSATSAAGVVERREQLTLDRGGSDGCVEVHQELAHREGGNGHDQLHQQLAAGPQPDRSARARRTVLGATPTFMGGAKTLKLTLKAGTYTFYCSVPGHRAAGMHGTLTVQ